MNFGAFATPERHIDYADQNRNDYRAFVQQIRDGQIQAVMEA